MFRTMLMGGASRAAFAPENDQGFDDDDQDSGRDLDEGLDGEDEPDESDDDRSLPDGDADVEDIDDGAESRPAAKVRKPNRAQERIRNLENERRQDRERADRLERELQEVRNGPRRSQEEVASERRERLSLMTADEKAEYLADETRSITDRRLAQIEFNSADRADRADFRALCASDRVVAAVQADVEEELVKIRRNGGNTDRETIATYLIGKRARDKAGSVRDKTQRKAQVDLDRERGRSTAPRSDVPRRDTRQNDNTRTALRARLKDVII